MYKKKEESQITFEDLPKYLRIDTGEDMLYYHPTIIKWENDGISNAYFAMYARYYLKSGQINPKQVLFFVNAGTFNEVVQKFIAEYRRNEEYIKDGRIWTGERPKIIDLTNTSIDGYFMVRNVNRPKI